MTSRSVRTRAARLLRRLANAVDPASVSGVRWNVIVNNPPPEKWDDLPDPTVPTNG